MIATTINYKTIQVKITEFDIDWDYNPWDMPPDYDLEREMRHSIFEVEVDPSYPDDGDENRQCIFDQIIEQEGFSWQVDNIDWEVITP